MLPALRDGRSVGMTPSVWKGDVPGPFGGTTTGADARFHLTHVGRVRVVRLRIDGPSIVMVMPVAPGTPLPDRDEEGVSTTAPSPCTGPTRWGPGLPSGRRIEPVIPTRKDQPRDEWPSARAERSKASPTMGAVVPGGSRCAPPLLLDRLRYREGLRHP